MPRLIRVKMETAPPGRWAVIPFSNGLISDADIFRVVFEGISLGCAVPYVGGNRSGRVSAGDPNGTYDLVHTNGCIFSVNAGLTLQAFEAATDCTGGSSSSSIVGVNLLFDNNAYPGKVRLHINGAIVGHGGLPGSASLFMRPFFALIDPCDLFDGAVIANQLTTLGQQAGTENAYAVGTGGTATITRLCPS